MQAELNILGIAVTCTRLSWDELEEDDLQVREDFWVSSSTPWQRKWRSIGVVIVTIVLCESSEMKPQQRGCHEIVGVFIDSVVSSFIDGKLHTKSCC